MPDRLIGVQCQRCMNSGLDTYVNAESPTGYTERPCPVCGPKRERLKFIRDSLPFWKSIISIDEKGVKRLVAEIEFLLDLVIK